MKRTICMLFAVVLLALTGCGGSKPTPSDANTELHPEVASQGRADMLETADGVYSVWTTESGRKPMQLIYFCPAGESSFYPLCSKPDCGHNDENCNACAGFAFGYYNGYLYTVVGNSFQQRYDILRMNTDGTERTSVANLPRPSNGSAEARIHGGKLYLEYMPDGALPLEEQIPRIVVVDLETLEQTEPFAEVFTTEGVYAMGFECFSGDKCYISGEIRGKDYDGDDLSFPFIELDIKTPTLIQFNYSSATYLQAG